MNYTDEELVSLYKQGDLNAFNELYLRYKQVVKYVARNLFLLGADYEDLLQEGMLGLIKAVNLYKAEESSFKTFATLCIKSSLYSAVKKYAGTSSLPLNNSSSFDILDKLGLSDENPEEEILKKEGVSELYKIFATNLSKTEMTILNLYLKGLSYAEISEITAKNVKAIDNALQRTRKKIINLLSLKNISL
ncbi:MAG: sigma-70 family RNA polymerase sigma factor [Clostridia bacterium]|nr:sigma-70 family RNA polymerase sigma factor [Clostridia bacterium]